MSKWFRLSNGREELIANEDHFKRLLDEGAVEIDDPTAQVPLQEETSQTPGHAIESPEGSGLDDSAEQGLTGQENALVDPGKPSEPDNGKSKRKGSGF